MKQNKPQKARHGGMPINQNAWEVRKEDQKFKAGPGYIHNKSLSPKKGKSLILVFINRGQVSYLSAVLFLLNLLLKRFKNIPYTFNNH